MLSRTLAFRENRKIFYMEVIFKVLFMESRNRTEPLTCRCFVGFWAKGNYNISN